MTKIQSAIRNPQSAIIWIIFAVFIVALYFFGLTIPLVGPDEPRYAQVAREMFERGDWITPTLGGYHWFEKPALLYWLQIGSYHFFGVNEFAARFGSALFGLGTIASLWILGRNLATEDTEILNQDESQVLNISVPSVVNSFATWLALIAASTLGLIVFARGASFDIIITFPLTAALVSFFIFERSKETRYLPLALFYFFIGVALLAKGLIGIVFPFAIVGFYYLLSLRLPRRAFVLSLFWGTLLAITVASLWYLPMYLRHGWEFIDEFFIQHHFQRYTSNKYQHPQPFYFYLWVLPLMTLPWTPFFLASVYKTVKTIGANVRSASESPLLLFPPSPLLRFAAAWLIVPLVFFSLSGSKLPGYILPAVPAAIIFAAIYLYPRIRRSARWRNTIMATALVMFAVIAGLLIRAVPRYAEDDSVKSLIAAADARGMSDLRVLMLHTISHNAEFYAAGRLLRDGRGKQRRFSGNDELLAEVAARGPAVVFVPNEYLQGLTLDERFLTEVMADTEELAAVHVSLR